MMMNVDELRVRAMIERRQQEQAASMMLAFPSRHALDAQQQHGVTTPMSSMPADMAANLPTACASNPAAASAATLPVGFEQMTAEASRMPMQLTLPTQPAQLNQQQQNQQLQQDGIPPPGTMHQS